MRYLLYGALCLSAAACTNEGLDLGPQRQACGAPNIDAGARDTEPVVVECDDDVASPNDTRNTAHVLTQSGQLDDLTVCRGEADWFAVDLEPGFGFQVESCVDAGEPEPEFAYFRGEFPDPTNYLGGGQRAPRKCSGTGVVSGADGRYWMKVSTDQPSVRYALVTQIVANRPPTSCTGATPCNVIGYECRNGECLCVRDAFEPNNDPTAAKPLAFGVDHEITVCRDEDDWFVLSAAEDETIDFTMAQESSGLTITATLFCEAHPDAPIQMNANGGQPFSFTAPVTGQYFLRLRAAKFEARATTVRIDRR